MTTIRESELCVPTVKNPWGPDAGRLQRQTARVRGACRRAL